jgi:Mn2+/Fe2+ NRAMP family transporter
VVSEGFINWKTSVSRIIPLPGLYLRPRFSTSLHLSPRPQSIIVCISDSTVYRLASPRSALPCLALPCPQSWPRYCPCTATSAAIDTDTPQPFARRLVTRLIGVIPAATIAAALGNQGLNTMLVASQVLLSIVLPTVIFPLVYLCSKEEIMTVHGPEVEGEVAVTEGNGTGASGLDHQERTNQSYRPPRMEGMSSPSRRSAQVFPRPISPNLRDLTPSVSFSGVLPQALAVPPDPPTRPTSEPSQRSLRSRGDASLPAIPPVHENTPTTSTATAAAAAAARDSTPSPAPAPAPAPAQTQTRTQRRQKSYVSPWWWTSLGYLLFAVVCLANGYVIVELILGNG